MHKRLVTVALSTLSIPALGLAAFISAHSVSETPAPQVIIPSTSPSSTGGAGRSSGGDAPVPRDSAKRDGSVISARDQVTPAGAAGVPSSSTRNITATTVGHHDGGLESGTAVSGGTAAPEPETHGSTSPSPTGGGSGPSSGRGADG
jgi:hypothetical protein